MLLRPLIASVMLVAALGLGWIAYKALNPAVNVAAVAAPAASVRVLGAAQPLQAGTLLKETDLREREFAADAVPDGSFPISEDSRAEVRGAMLRRYLDPGAVLAHADVLRPRDRGFLAAVLGQGTRAVSIGVDAKTGASGLISPGDLVDVILTQEFQRGDTPVGRRVAAETVLTSVRVIAVDQQIAQGAPAAVATPAAGAGTQVAKTVTLQVTPEQAERVAVAERLGWLVLSVRSIDPEDAPNNAASRPLLASSDAPSERTVAANGTPRTTGPTVFGSDVSAALSRDEPAA